tara:strand:- start:393 stop:1388 length:996 start_codon:yes stop_codon:yes gene_type:complete
MTSKIKVDTIEEKTSGNGVVIDSVTLKDGGITATAASTISTSDNTTQLQLISTDADSSGGPVLDLFRNSSSPADGDTAGKLLFTAKDDGGNTFTGAALELNVNDIRSSFKFSELVFRNMLNGTLTETISILSDASPSVVFNEGSADIDFRVESNGLDDALVVDAGTDFVGIGCKTTPSASNGGVGFVKSTNSRMEAVFATTTTGGNDLINFVNGNGVVGKVTTSGSGTTFSTTSDYRLKENVNYDFDATTELKKLKPAKFNFKADENTKLNGFLAHEVADIVPEAISGEKDEVDEDGNIKPQGIDQSKLVPLMVKTIQELEARITELENAE